MKVTIIIAMAASVHANHHQMRRCNDGHGDGWKCLAVRTTAGTNANDLCWTGTTQRAHYGWWPSHGTSHECADIRAWLVRENLIDPHQCHCPELYSGDRHTTTAVELPALQTLQSDLSLPQRDLTIDCGIGDDNAGVDFEATIKKDAPLGKYWWHLTQDTFFSRWYLDFELELHFVLKMTIRGTKTASGSFTTPAYQKTTMLFNYPLEAPMPMDLQGTLGIDARGLEVKASGATHVNGDVSIAGVLRYSPDPQPCKRGGWFGRFGDGEAQNFCLDLAHDDVTSSFGADLELEITGSVELAFQLTVDDVASIYTKINTIYSSKTLQKANGQRSSSTVVEFESVAGYHLGLKAATDTIAAQFGFVQAQIDAAAAATWPAADSICSATNSPVDQLSAKLKALKNSWSSWFDYHDEVTIASFERNLFSAQQGRRRAFMIMPDSMMYNPYGSFTVMPVATTGCCQQSSTDATAQWLMTTGAPVHSQSTCIALGGAAVWVPHKSYQQLTGKCSHYDSERTLPSPAALLPGGAPVYLTDLAGYEGTYQATNNFDIILTAAGDHMILHYDGMPTHTDLTLRPGAYGGFDVPDFPSDQTMLPHDRHITILRSPDGQVSGLIDNWFIVYEKMPPPPPPPPVTCFDAATTFISRSGPNGAATPKRADALQVGDEVRVATRDGRVVWDRVAIDVSHGANARNTYVQIRTAQRMLHISPDHYLHTARPSADATTPSCCSNSTLHLASTVAVGDLVWALNPADSAAVPAPELVTSVDNVQRDGAYNFVLEQAGDLHFRSIIADGIVASSFTSDWRLINSFGFHMSDRLLQPVRELAALGLIESNLTHEADGGDFLRSPLMRMVRELEGVVADCLEAHMQNCTQEEVQPRVAAVLATAQEQMSTPIYQALGRLVEGLAHSHGQWLSTAATSVRRMLSSLAPTAATPNATETQVGVVVTLLVFECRKLASDMCSTDGRCKDHMPPDAVPTWSIPIFMIGGAVLALSLVVLILLCHRYYCKKAAPALPVVAVPAPPVVATVAIAEAPVAEVVEKADELKSAA